MRRIQGVLSLAKKYGVAAVEDACAAALEMGVCEYRFVRRYLERQPATAAEPAASRSADPPTHPVSRLHSTQDQGEPHHEPHGIRTLAYDNCGSAAWPPCSKPDCARRKPNPWHPSI